MDHYYLDFEPLSKMFYVADVVIRKFKNEGKVPILGLDPGDYPKLGCVTPKESAPVVGILAGRSGDCYSVSRRHILALAKKGFIIRLLSYEYCNQQLNTCHGIVLAGENFFFPKHFFAESKQPSSPISDVRVWATLLYLRLALKQQIPILGIGDGALVIAAEFGLKMYPDAKCIESPILHRANKPVAHRIDVFPNTPLSRLLGCQSQMFVNSWHTAILAPRRKQYEVFAEKFNIDISKAELPFDIYAEANDGVPEAWGAEKLHILCVQWHPEEAPEMLDIYQGLAEDIAILR